MINLPLVSDRLAVRAVLYSAQEPGWIDNDRPGGKNSNHIDVAGGRLALGAGWRLDRRAFGYSPSPAGGGQPICPDIWSAFPRRDHARTA
jgi:hypothetical protein